MLSKQKRIDLNESYVDFTAEGVAKNNSESNGDRHKIS